MNYKLGKACAMCGLALGAYFGEIHYCVTTTLKVKLTPAIETNRQAGRPYPTSDMQFVQMNSTASSVGASFALNTIEVPIDGGYQMNVLNVDAMKRGQDDLVARFLKMKELGLFSTKAFDFMERQRTKSIDLG